MVREILRKDWPSWHRFWTRLFGAQLPTSAERAHIGNLTLQHRPHADAAGFGRDWSTDARRIYIIGDLWVFDYGDAPFQILTPAFQPEPRDLGDHAALLAENIRDHGTIPLRTLLEERGG